jgi:hypothetical protein
MERGKNMNRKEMKNYIADYDYRAAAQKRVVVRPIGRSDYLTQVKPGMAPKALRSAIVLALSTLAFATCLWTVYR